MDKPRIKAIMFTVGYAESEATSAVIVRRVYHKGFRTVRGAIKRFLLDCRDVNAIVTNATQRSCCKTSASLPKPPRYCPECGESLGKSELTAGEEVAQLLHEMNTQSVELDAEVYEEMLERGWEIGVGLPPSGDVVSVSSLDYIADGREGGPIRRFSMVDRRVKFLKITVDYL